MKTKIIAFVSSLTKNFLTWAIIMLGAIAALMGVQAFQQLSTTPSNPGNQSLSSPMLSKSGSVFNRNYHSLEAIANALGLPSEGSGKRVFVTRQRWDWNLWGLAGADAKCQAAADARSLGGTWKAILSSSTTDAVSRLSPAQTIFNINGEIVAFNPLNTWLFGLWKAKTNSAQYEIRWPLITDEFWVYYTNSAVSSVYSTTISQNQAIHFWSNTWKDGERLWNQCGDWTALSTFSGGMWYLNNGSFEGTAIFNGSYTTHWHCPYSPSTGGSQCQYCNTLRSLLCQEQ